MPRCPECSCRFSISTQKSGKVVADFLIASSAGITAEGRFNFIKYAGRRLFPLLGNDSIDRLL